ncbi:MAG: flagellum-specific ATP synthase FliI, partial [Desulfobacterales bacterium]
VSKEHRQKAQKFKEVLATYRRAEDLINIGAYVNGSNPKIDYAIQMIEKLNDYLKQAVEETCGFEESVRQLEGLFG